MAAEKNMANIREGNARKKFVILMITSSIHPPNRPAIPPRMIPVGTAMVNTKRQALILYLVTQGWYNPGYAVVNQEDRLSGR